jgi:SAM-dependent methyltransferase
MTEEERRVTRETYEAIAAEYAERDNIVIPVSADTVAAWEAFVSRVPDPKRILDLGSGAGRDARGLAERGCLVRGLDFSAAMVETAARLSPGISFVQADMEEGLPFPEGGFDGVWANASLHHVAKSALPKIFREAFRILAPAGIFFVRVYHGEGEGMVSQERFGRTIHRYFARYQPQELEAWTGKAGFTGFSHSIAGQGKWLDVVVSKQP